MVEGVSTFIFSTLAFVSLFVMDGWVMKVAGVFVCLLLAYFVAWVIDKIKGEA